MATYNVVHLDTCYPEFLQDHHNRDGEYLVGVTVDGATTIKDVTDQLMSECLEAELPEGITTGHGEAAVMACMDQMGEPDEMFDADLEVPTRDDDERPSAWFLLTWSE